MSITGATLPVSASVMFLAGSSDWFLPFPAEILQGGALLTLSWTVFHMLSKTLPAHLRAIQDVAAANRRESKSQREDFIAMFKELENHRCSCGDHVESD